MPGGGVPALLLPLVLGAEPGGRRERLGSDAAPGSLRCLRQTGAAAGRGCCSARKAALSRVPGIVSCLCGGARTLTVRTSRPACKPGAKGCCPVGAAGFRSERARWWARQRRVERPGAKGLRWPSDLGIWGERGGRPSWDDPPTAGRAWACGRRRGRGRFGSGLYYDCCYRCRSLMSQCIGKTLFVRHNCAIITKSRVTRVARKPL